MTIEGWLGRDPRAAGGNGRLIFLSADELKINTADYSQFK